MTDRKPLWTKEDLDARIALLSPQDRELLAAKVQELEARAVTMAGEIVGALEVTQGGAA